MPTPDDSELADVLAEARPADPAGVALARARVASALFGQAATLGRFHVLERLGKGGMGVVYAAYDPELDRKVALKMVSVPAGGREVALAEAKALAKLSHPNVVPVFDVGLVDEHVYIVMELVRGKTLRDWVTSKRAKDIVDAYRQAAMALAAAHAERLVHRDFKPDNAIVGDDGRVRVVDFGLACEAQTGEDPNRIGGTPKYMSPERAITPATDQFAFCVSLAEAFDDEPPAWIAAIVERGRAKDPRDRYPAMTDVVRALGRDPARIWRNRAIAIAAAGVAVAAFVVGQSQAASSDADVCSGGDVELDQAWPTPTRTTSIQRIAGLSDYGRELAPRIDQSVAAFRASWLAGYRNACMVRRADVQSASMFDRRMSCLARGKSALETVAEISNSVSRTNVGDVARALAALPDVKRCSDLVALSSEVEPPSASLEPSLAPLRADLEHARVQLAAGRAADAHAIAERATRALRGLGYLPLVAEGLLVDGHALMSGHAEDAIAILRDATTTAFAANVDAIAVEAWARRAWLDGMRDREDALAGLDVVMPVADRTRSAFARALLLNNLGSVQIERGKLDDARASFTRALAIARDVTGQNAVELVAVQQNLARVTDDLDQRAALQAGAVRDLARLLGAAHPDVLIGEMIYAASGVVASRDARAILAKTCPKMTAHDRLAPLLRACFAELAFIADDLDDRAGAIAAIDQAQDAPTSEQSGAPEIAGMHALLHGNPSAALAAFTTALADDPIEPGQNAYRNLGHARLRLGEARALMNLGKPDQARSSLEIAEPLLAAGEATATAAVRRRLARVRAELASFASPRDRRDQSGRYATAALDWYRRAGTAPARLADLDKLASTKESR